MFIDSHSHTKHFSGDGRMDISELISGSLAASLQAIVITEHLTMTIRTTLITDGMRYDAYFESFQKWKLRPGV